ncbi:MAG TPA: sialidase family protein [Ktedonobacteraceae bacterium]|nr:sialidase family protein [Ktedonobacteraceae bacterium]
MPRKQAYVAFIVALFMTLVTLAACGGTTPEPLPVQSGPLNVRVSRDAYPAHASPSVAVNPRNPHNLLGTAVLLQLNPAYPSKSNTISIDHVGTFFSMDGGMQWRDNGPLPLPAGFIESNGESLAFNAQGTGFIVAVLSSALAQNALTRIVLWRSSDGGATFSAPMTVAQGSGDSNPALAIDASSGALNIVWSEQTTILFTRSTNNGQTFSTPHSISGSSPSLLPGITVGPKGIIHVVYADVSNRAGFALPLDVVTSNDGGQNFSSPRAIPNVVASYFVGAQPLHLDSFFSITTDPHDGTLYVAYTADRVITDSTGNNTTVEDNTDVLLSSSYNGGKTWNRAVRINDDPLSDSDSHFQPQLAVAPNGTLYVSYLTLYNADSFIDVYLTQSNNHGADFMSSHKISSVSWNPANGVNGWVGDHQGLAIEPTKVYVMWGDTRASHLEIYMAAVGLT